MSISKTSPKASMSRLWRWTKQHKLASSAIVVLLVITAGICAYQFHAYTQKFSKADYDQLTAMAESVLKDSGGKDIQVSRTCSYERPGEFSDLHLYCQIAMVAYLRYENDERTITVAKNLVQHSGDNSIPLMSTSDFYAHPENNALTIYIRPLQTHSGTKCRFEIATLRFAMKLGIGLPDATDKNLIAVSFYCSAESRAEYFPVTYRQG